MGTRFKQILVVLMGVALLMPLAQQTWGWVQEKPLQGYFPPAPKPAFSWNNWSTATFQDSLESYNIRHFGFHQTATRTLAQTYFSLLHISIANNVILGKNHWLLDKSHIQAAAGVDSLPEALLYRQMAMLSDLARIFRQKGIQFAVVVGPGKADLYPESVPEGYPKASEITNRTRWKEKAARLGIPIWDLVPGMQTLKKQIPYPLFPSGGIHWSEFGAEYVASILQDSLSLHLQTPLPEFETDSLVFPDPPRGEEEDIALGMNLLWTISQDPLAHSSLRWSAAPKKGKVLTIGDSFFSSIQGRFMGNMVEESGFWFYFDRLERIGAHAGSWNKAEIDLIREMDRQDAILLFCSTPNLPKLGWGFIQTAWETYFLPEKRNPFLDKIEANIRSDAHWMEIIQEKATAAHLPLDTMVRRDALYIFENSRIQP